MTMTLRKAQAFIHNNYRTVLLTLVVLMVIILLFFSAFMVMAQQNRDSRVAVEKAEQAAARAEAVAQVLETVKAQTQEIKEHQTKDTELIICLLAIHGEETAISEADRISCRGVIKDAEQAIEGGN